MSMNHKSAMISVEDMQIARVYAEASYAAAGANGSQGELADELDAVVAELLDKNQRLETFFLVASISRDQRRQLLDSAFKGRVGDQTYRLLATLNHHDRLGVLRAVAAQVRRLVGEAAGVVKATVTTAAPLSTEQVGRLERVLEKGLKAKPQLEFRVDPSVLGGMRVAVGETVYDDTVQSNLGRLREGILTRSAHEIQSGRDHVDHSA
jgi:F-type H+-transporting ATPase subunit delta